MNSPEEGPHRAPPASHGRRPARAVGWVLAFILAGTLASSGQAQAPDSQVPDSQVSDSTDPAPQDVSEDDAPDPRSNAISDSLAFEILRQIAREDTLGLPPQIDYVFDRYLDIEDRRPTVKEIIGWAIEHESRRYEGIDDMSYLERVRSIEFYEPDEPDGRRRLVEAIERIYVSPPDEIIRVKLGERTWDSKEDAVRDGNRGRGSHVLSRTDAASLFLRAAR